MTDCSGAAGSEWFIRSLKLAYASLITVDTFCISDIEDEKNSSEFSELSNAGDMGHEKLKTSMRIVPEIQDR